MGIDPSGGAKKKKKCEKRELRSGLKPKGTILAGQVVIDCQWEYLWQCQVCLFISHGFADFF